jgi:hypothetical protein
MKYVKVPQCTTVGDGVIVAIDKWGISPGGSNEPLGKGCRDGAYAIELTLEEAAIEILSGTTVITDMEFWYRHGYDELKRRR